jgi:CspA family cold shock protein
MNQGTPKLFNGAKGYGFVKDAQTGEDYFVYISELVDVLRENNEVTFDLKKGRKGLNAVNGKLV